MVRFVLHDNSTAILPAPLLARNRHNTDFPYPPVSDPSKFQQCNTHGIKSELITVENMLGRGYSWRTIQRRFGVGSGLCFVPHRHRNRCLRGIMCRGGRHHHPCRTGLSWCLREDD